MPYEKIANIKGPKGDKGDTGTFASATATTLPPGSLATVAITGAEHEKQVTFGIPRGAQGLPGTNAVPADEAVAGYVSTVGESATKAALQAGFLARELTERAAIRYGTTETAFHQTGMTLRGPIVPTADDNGPTDQGARITIHSSHGGTSLNQRGEGLRLMVDTDQAKNMIAWYDNFTNPGSPKAKAWIGYHHGTAPDIVHNHISIETPDSTGGLYSRFGISTQHADVANVDFSGADVQVSASQGGAFRVAVAAGSQTSRPRDIIFATGVDHVYTRRRWAIRADTAAEGGAADGSDFRILRYDNNGDSLPGTVLAITRKDGHIGIGVEPQGSYRVNVQSSVFGAARFASSASSASSGLIRLESSNATGLIFDALVTGETFRRFAVDAAGRHNWGSGSAAYDTALYREAANTLATGGDLEIVSPTRGVVLRAGNGARYRLGVSNTGQLTTTAI